MLTYPSWVADLHAQEDAVDFGEDPLLISKEALEPISGRKEWKLRHKKKVKNIFKKYKNGFVGLA